ncbi:insulin [Engraulis encrasicolus]|uniref:insulin n=1 Tax=Engraulis encrasicolus TaxID=184585 RepID=UPI002FD41F02
MYHQQVLSSAGVGVSMSGLGVLLLLLLGCVCLSPGPPSVLAVPLSAHRLCGVHLVDALLLVCGERGLFYRPGKRVREENIGLRVMMDSAPSLEETRVILDSRGGRALGSTIAKRGIVEQCCFFYCDFYDLENYCNT